MAADNISLLVDAKTEYTNQLVGLLQKPLYEGFKSLFDDAVNVCNDNNQEGAELKTFQNLLGRIPQWNQEIIDNECDRIKISCKCEWLEDLISAVFVSHTRVLTNMNSKNKINLSVPKLSKFIHKVYINIARQFWKNPFLFSSEGISQFEYQKNIRECEHIISESVQESIRILLPVKNILKEYLGGTNKEDGGEDDEVEDNDITKDNYQVNNIKKMIENDTFLKDIILQEKSSKKTTKKNETETEENKTEETNNSTSNESADKNNTSDIENTETVDIKKETESEKVADKDTDIISLESLDKDKDKSKDKKEAQYEDKKEDKSEDNTPTIDIKTLQEINESSLPIETIKETVEAPSIDNLNLADLPDENINDILQPEVLDKPTIDTIDLSSLPVTDITQHLPVENIPIEEQKPPTIDTLDVESLPVVETSQQNLNVEDLTPPSPEITLDNIDLDSIPVNTDHDLELDNISNIVDSPKSLSSPISLKRTLDFDSSTKHNQLDYNSYQNIINPKNIQNEVLNEIDGKSKKEHSFF